MPVENHKTPSELMPEDDRAFFMDFYKKNRPVLIGNKPLTPEQFAKLIGDRIWDEWDRDRSERGRGFSRAPYDGGAYTRFRDDEIHYALERRGNAGGDGNPEIAYQEIRSAILRAIAERAHALFGAWQGRDFPVNAAERNLGNLRTSLRDYLAEES